MIGGKREKNKINIYKEISNNLGVLTDHAENFLKPQPEKLNDFKQLIQQSYCASISGNIDKKDEILPELVLEDMDDEQIWQQLEIRNNLVFEQLLKQTAKLTAIRDEHLGIQLAGEDDDEEEEEDVNDDEDNEEDEAELDESGSELENKLKAKAKQLNGKPKLRGKPTRRSIVDDTFFKLDEMKAFLEQEDAKEMRKQKNKSTTDDTDGIDYFADDFGIGDEDDEEAGNLNFADFFDVDDELAAAAQFKAKKNKRYEDLKTNRKEEEQSDNQEEEVEDEQEEADEEEQEEDEEGDDDEAAASEIDENEFVEKSGFEPASDSGSDDDADDDADQAEEPAQPLEPQSSNELREARLLQRIRDYENVVLGEKPWQLKGEVQAGHRPQNSLLEEILEFDSTTRPVAQITEEDNRTIEDFIMQRIRDKAWDDVERTVRPTTTPQEYRKQLVLDQEKSKQSLAQVYEKEYQRELDKLNPNRDADDSATPEPKEHQEIRNAMRSLFLKLDALSNFHFTPKPVAPEIKIVTNTPAVNMEEVAPVAVSDATLLAPEEIFRGPKHSLLGKSERTRTDKNRERRKKKQKQRAINSAVEARAKQGKAPTEREASAKLLKQVTKNRNVDKIKTSNDKGALKSSKAFFNQLQDTTSNKRPKKEPPPSKSNAKKLKL